MLTSLPVRRLVAPSLIVAALAAGCGPSSEALQEQARRGVIAPDPALHTLRSISIAAPPARVWALLTDISGWPAWHRHPTVPEARAANGVVVGQPFDWNQEGTRISSRFAMVEPERRLVWTGTVSIASAVHMWRLSPEGRGTRLEVEEGMWGFMLWAFYPQRKLDRDLEGWLTDLRAAAEAPAPGSDRGAGMP
jgi:uncharacterized protein YndB with AHSA1/START domain